ncbi:MAG: cation:proton antiporter [Alphaproteobacteria bacterium]
MNFQPIAQVMMGVCAMLAVIAFIQHYAKKSLLPPEAWLMIAGIAYGIAGRTVTPGLPHVMIEPVVVLMIILPLLIFASGREINLTKLKSVSIPVAFYSVLGVIMSMFLIGVPLFYITDLSLPDALFFGAAVSATDPGAVSSILRRFRIPDRLFTIIEGESLFNDATTVVMFTIMASVVLTGEVFNWQEASLQFSWAVVAAIPLGWVLGWIFGELASRWQQTSTYETLSLSIILAFMSYILSEQYLHVSGVITVLFAAIKYSRTCGLHGKSALVRKDMWSYVTLLINSYLFFALGAETGAHDFPISWILLEAVVILIAARIIMVYVGGSLFGKGIPMAWRHIMMLSGLRGAICVALLLMIPDSYEYKGYFLCLAYLIILFPLVFQPLALHRYLKVGAKGR